MSSDKTNIINKELQRLTEIQKVYVEKIEEINKDKTEYITKTLSVFDKEKMERFKKISKRMAELQSEFYKRKDSKIGIMDSDIMRMYKKISRRLFYKKTPLGFNFKMNKDGHHYLSEAEGKPIAWGVNGLGYLFKYYSWKKEKISSFNEVEEVISALKNNPNIKNIECQKTPERQEMFTKLCELMVRYKYISQSINEIFELKVPILTVVPDIKTEEDLDKDENMLERIRISGYGVKHQRVIPKTVKSIYIYISPYEWKIESCLDNTKYTDIEHLEINAKVDYKHLAYYISQLPEEVLTYLEKYLDNIDAGIENNEQVLEEFRKEFGYILLVEAL